jgi:hypothetical protein
MLALTTVFLIAIFIAAEFYRFGQKITGWIREIRPIDGDPTGLAGACLRVRTSRGDEVTALISGCQMCISRIAVGKRVSLVPGPEGYLVKTAWTSGQSRHSCPKGGVR